MTSAARRQFRVLLALAFTLAAIHWLPDRVLTALVLLAGWSLAFLPLAASELVLFVFATAFFLVQNYLTLKDGLFEFRFKDILLMPWYEPPMWGFYFLALKRFISGRAADAPPLAAKAFVGVVVTSVIFSAFGRDSHVLFAATAASTTFLLVLFHTRRDLAFAVCALALGFVIELFGVSTGLWWYPAPDFLGIPFWFATMWMSVGLLGGRFLIPASNWIAARLVR